MLKQLFFLFFVRPIVMLISGVHLIGGEKLPKEGASIIVANHNSHFDTMVLMSLYPIARLPKVRAVAAHDYFAQNRLFSWFTQTIIGTIFVKRRVTKEEGHPLQKVFDALERGESVIYFPEGSRGEPDVLSTFKTGIAHLAKAFPEVPIIRIYLHGTGKVLPKNEALFVPLIVDVVIGDAIFIEANETHQAFTKRLQQTVIGLQHFN